MAMTVDDLTRALQETFGTSLTSVVLYGSAAAGDHAGRRSNYNVLVVAERIDPAQLRAFSPIARRWARDGNPPPLFFTEDRLRASCDAFPIELSDIRQAHRMLYGRDVVSDLTVTEEHLRLELERELKGKLLQLRERYLLAADRPREVTALLIESLSTFLVLARAALRLWQADGPATKLEAAQALAGHVPFHAAVLERLASAKAGGRLAGDPHQVFAEYLQVIETIVDAVDARLRARAA